MKKLIPIIFCLPFFLIHKIEIKMSNVIHVKGVSDYLATIKGEKRVIVVDFSASWCGPCKKLGFILDELSQKYAQDILVLKIDIDEDGKLDEDEQLSSIVKVTSLPTICFVKDGQFQYGEDYRIVGLKANQLLWCLSTLTGKSFSIQDQ